MGVFTYENEVTSVVPPAKLFKAFILDADNLYSKIIPSHPQTEIVGGDGGPGTIKKITFSHGNSSYIYHLNYFWYFSRSLQLFKTVFLSY